jgi:hypothetical protein
LRCHIVRRNNDLAKGTSIMQAATNAPAFTADLARADRPSLLAIVKAALAGIFANKAEQTETFHWARGF